MKYKIYDPIKKVFVTDNFNFTLNQNGELFYYDENENKDISATDYIILFYPTEDNHYWIDSVGGTHDSGLGWNPIGEYYGECSEASCKTCWVWDIIKDK